jgi:predicted helicase
MVIIGNPPYSVSSSNKSEWIEKLMIDYKKNLNEKNIQPLSDDYLKFIRFGQYFIEKNGEGILAFISNNSFVDGIIHRQFRKHLLENFDKIYILNLHGNSRKKEVCPDGSKDENVFDIMQGVSINIFIKTGKKKVNELGEVYHYDLYGKRDDKYDFLWNNNLESIKFTKLPNVDPSYFFVEKSFEGINEYENGFKIDEVFKIFNAGSATGKDELFVDIKKNELLKKLELNNIIFDSNKIEKYNYRLFDIRYFIYDNKLIQRLRHNLMKNLKKENICLITTKILSSQFYTHSFVSNIVGDRCVISNKGQEANYFFPLYIYPDSSEQTELEIMTNRQPNLNLEIVKNIAEKLNLKFTNEKENTQNTFAPIDIFDYIYAILNSPKYREKYKEFLKIDFPRVPYPINQENFWKLVELGSELRQIHLLESPIVEKFITSYPKSGNNKITHKITKNDWEFYDTEKKLGKIWINDEQYFDKIPLVAWDFFIGGYQPAQKWLKDRFGRDLNFDEILHYQKIIVALNETDRLMKEIDKNI